MDERAFEMAQEREEGERQAAIQARVRYQGVSRADCAECGEDIPVNRQQAVPGVQLCFECQSILDIRTQPVRRV